MRRFTLFLSLLVAFVTTTMAQSIDLTFTKVSATDATVAVAGNDIAVDGVTATITANYDWKALNANSQKFPNASILCPDKNTNAMTAGTGAEGIFTITLNNLPAGYSYKNVTFTSVALNGGGEFQGDDVNAQPVNFELTAAGEVVGTIENKPIKVNSNSGESVVVNFEVAEAYPATDGSLELKLKLATTESKGCFYGLIKVSIEAVEEETPVAPSYTVTAEAQDPTMGTATVEVVDGVATFKAVPNEGYKFVDWLFGGEATGQAAEFSFPVEMNMELVAVFEAIEEIGGPNFADGVYEIKNASANGARGYFVYSTEYPTTAQLAGVELSGYESKHYAYGDPKTNSYWYLYTVESTGARYLFNIAEGHFLSKGDFLTNDDSGQSFYASFLSKEIAAPVTIEESTHRAGYYNLKVNGTHYLASSCGWAQNATPVRLSSGQADDGNPLELIPAADVTVDAAVMAAVKAVIDPTAVEPDPEPVVELYRLKNDNGYLNVSNYLSHPTGPAGGVNVVAFADSDDQKFTIEDAGNGQVYLKSVSGYYINCHQWNVDGSADNKTALTFESNGENTFYLKQAGGYFKLENVNVIPVALINGQPVDQPAVSGWYPFCDAKKKSDAATWSLEKVEETPVAPSYTVTAEAQDATMGTATVEVVDGVAYFKAVPNEGYKFVDWLFGGEATGQAAEFSFPVEMNMELVAVFEAIEGGETPEPSAGFEWASKTDVLIEAQGYYAEVLGTMYTLTADVTTDDATTFPASLDFGLAYYPGYDDGAGFVLPAYYYVAWYNTYRTDYNTDMVLEPAADGKTATLDINKSLIGGGNYIYDANFGKAALTLTANEDGTISMSDFIVSDGDGLEALATYTNVKLTKKAAVVPTELTVKSYSPKKEVTSLETIEIEFSDAIATRISGSTGIVCPDGHTEAFMDREKDGKVLRLTLNPAQTAEGTYTLTIPAGVIKNAEGLEYAGGEFTFTVKQPKYLVGEVDPADKSSVESLNRIVFTYADGTSIYAKSAEQITVTDKDGNSVSTAVYNYTGLGWNQVGVKLNTPITTVGTYTVTIPEGLMYDYGSGDISPAYTLTYTVEEPKAPTEYTYNTKKNVHSARALQSFTIVNLDTEASMKVEDIQVVGAGSPVFVDKTAQVLEVQPGNTIYFSEFTWAGEWMHGYAFIDYNHDFIFDSNLNADGTTGGELVSYNHYNDKTSLGTASDSHWANTLDYEGSMGLPYFVLPADLAAGDYRMRIMIDWNNINANGTSDIHTNGGCQCDFILRVAGAVEPEPEPTTEYACFEGVNGHDVRALKSFTIADVDTESSMTVENIQVSGAGSPIYVDKTENVFEVKAGSTLYFEEFDWAGEWMHAYAYIDYNNDFVFDTNLNADGTTGGEVVSYNSFNDKTSWGDAVSGGKVNAGDYEGSKGLPHFVLPADLAAGDYRMRIKIDWNRLDANYGDDWADNNNPKVMGGCQCDIVIRIVGDEPTPPAKNYVEIVNVVPSDNSTVASLSFVLVEFDENEYIYVVNAAAEVKDAEGNVVTTATVGYKNEAGEMMAAWQVGIVLDEAITEAGTYTITLPEGAVSNYIDGNAEATFTFTVDPTLGINGVDAEGEQVIYDITGRRIEKINAAGVYIVNGVKVLVK